MNLIEGIELKGTNPDKNALMYYKTEPFVHGLRAYHHTNNWEILESIRILKAKPIIVVCSTSEIYGDPKINNIYINF